MLVGSIELRELIIIGKDRSRWEIILDILHVMKKEKKIKKTRLMQKAYLDWRNFKKYFDYLLEENFISESNPDTGSFSLTENGVELLDRLKKVNELLN
jgi:predicted transcriptional regulator